MWIKKHWNDPITVGGYTKFCAWNFLIAIIVAMVEVVCLGFMWLNWWDKVRAFWYTSTHKIETFRRKSKSQTEEES